MRGGELARIYNAGKAPPALVMNTAVQILTEVLTGIVCGGVSRRLGPLPQTETADLQAQHWAGLEAPGNATQQAEEAALAAHHAAQPEMVALNNRMELRQDEDHFELW